MFIFFLGLSLKVKGMSVFMAAWLWTSGHREIDQSSTERWKREIGVDAIVVVGGDVVASVDHEL